MELTTTNFADIYAGDASAAVSVPEATYDVRVADARVGKAESRTIFLDLDFCWIAAFPDAEEFFHTVNGHASSSQDEADWGACAMPRAAHITVTRQAATNRRTVSVIVLTYP